MSSLTKHKAQETRHYRKQGRNGNSVKLTEPQCLVSQVVLVHTELFGISLQAVVIFTGAGRRAGKQI